MAMRSIENLLDAFASTTEEGRLSWEAHGVDTYVAELPRYRARVWRWADPNDDTNGMTAQLQTKAGEVLDFASANEYSPKFAVLERIWIAARRSAHNVSAVIDEVEEELASLRTHRS